MPLLAFLARASLLRHLLGHSGRRPHRSAYGRSAPGPRGYGHSAYGRRHRSRSGFGMFGPFPMYSRRTRGGGRVSVGGCCLPIPLALAVATAAAARLAARR